MVEVYLECEFKTDVLVCTSKCSIHRQSTISNFEMLHQECAVLECQTILFTSNLS